MIIGGDINKLPCDKICNTFPDLVNLVASPTRGNQILDVLVSNLHPAYDKAVVYPPLQPDVAGHGQPSDHAVVIARQNLDKAARTGFARKVTRWRRKITKSNLALMGLFLLSFNWGDLSLVNGSDAKLGAVNEILFAAQEAFCPLQETSVRVDRHPFASTKLAWLSRKKAKEFRKHGYSEHFKQLKKL